MIEAKTVWMPKTSSGSSAARRGETGRRGNPSGCPLCGGRLRTGEATIPFVLPESAILIKDVPAEICQSCHEPYMIGAVVDRMTRLLARLRKVRAEVSVISYVDARSTSPPAPT
ncbi:MAG: type II toxin-antitoxin system MqsA family antitoxin [Candidatus Binatia bacterium]